MGRQRHFDRVRGLVSDQSGVPEAEITLDSRLVEDLGIVGDDGYEFLEVFADEFSVDMSHMDAFNYFDDEPPLSGSSSLLPVVGLFSARFRNYLCHVTRGRRSLTVRSLVASARAQQWITPVVVRSDADLTRFSWWNRVVLSASAGFPLIFGFWGNHSDSSPMPGGTLLLLTLISVLLITKLWLSLNWLKRLDAAASFEEQAAGRKINAED